MVPLPAELPILIQFIIRSAFSTNLTNFSKYYQEPEKFAYLYNDFL